MVETPSTMKTLGSPMPFFTLQTTEGKVASADFAQKTATVVIFMCNHCPFVKHILKKLVEVAIGYQAKDIGFVAINSNDTDHYPEDNFENMKLLVEEYTLPFPYAIDRDQQVALSFEAACTPDFFVYDHTHSLVYRGQFDDSRPGNHKPVTGKNLTETLDALLSEQPVPAEQFPSHGCNIKWKTENEPEYFRARI